MPESLYLLQFARFAEQQQAPRLTVQLAIDWACTSKRQTPITRAHRIMRLRGFAKYCQRFDPDGEIPPIGLFGRTRRRLVPHIYTEQELTERLDATSKLHPTDGMRPLTYRTIYGLLASCGLRISEAIRLTRADVDLDCGVLAISDTKRHKSRFVPLHSSAVRALEAYAHQRDLRVLLPQSNHFFLLDNGKPPSKPGRNGKRGYPDYKAARGLQPFRDWFWTGRTIRSLKVKSASENRCVIGFIDPNADRIAHVNNLRERAFGISPRDRQAMVAVIRAVLRTARVVRVARAA
jgi:integrase